MRLLVAACAAGLVLAAGCGDDDKDEPARPPPVSAPTTGSDEEQVKGVWRAYLENLGNGNGEGVCALITEKGRKEFAREAGEGGGSCEEVVEKLGPFFADYDADLTEIEVNGDRATAIAPKEGIVDAQRVELRRDGGRWKLDHVEDVKD